MVFAHGQSLENRPTRLIAAIARRNHRPEHQGRAAGMPESAANTRRFHSHYADKRERKKNHERKTKTSKIRGSELTPLDGFTSSPMKRRGCGKLS